MYQISDRRSSRNSRVVWNNGYGAAFAALVLLAYCSQPVWAQSRGAGKSGGMMATLPPGLHTVVRASGKDSNTPARAGG